MHFIAIALLLLHLVILVFISIEMFKNEDLPSHRKSFWFFVFLSAPVVGYMLYVNTDGKKVFKKPPENSNGF